VGRALATHKQEHQLLPKVLALPVFASDALSSTAYATEEMMLVLVVAVSGRSRCSRSAWHRDPAGDRDRVVPATVRTYPRGRLVHRAKENLGRCRD
jgi:hypothetical protein